MIAMIPIGIHRLDCRQRDDAEVEAVRERDDRDRDREQVDGERPQDVHQPREDAVGEAAEEAGDHRDDRREDAADQGRDGRDHERVPAAVEQARHHVAALGVRPEEVVVEVPRRADRRGADAERAAALLQDRHALAVHDRRAVDVRAERVGVRDVVRVERRREAGEHDEHEHHERDHRRPVPQQPAACQGVRPETCGAVLLDRAACLDRLDCPAHRQYRRAPITAPRPGRSGSSTGR